jgi:hypothetical protein
MLHLSQACFRYVWIYQGLFFALDIADSSNHARNSKDDQSSSQETDVGRFAIFAIEE